jgi:putative ABC transport system substrate-binding protein
MKRKTGHRQAGLHRREGADDARLSSRRKLLIVLGAGALVAPFGSFAQPQNKVWRIGVLETVPRELNAAYFNAFLQGLRELGYVEGQNIVFEYRSADGRQERFPALADELVRLKVDMIVTRGTPAALAAKKATKSIPLVMVGAGDPVGSGIVASLARPGGNITGLSALNVEISAKRFELLTELIPGIARIACLFDMGNPVNPPQWKETERAAQSRKIRTQLFDVRNADDLRNALDSAAKQRVGALIVGLDDLTRANRPRIIELAAQNRLPAIYGAGEFVDAGGLISYSTKFGDFYYRAATYVDKILKGAKPADIPVEQPTKFELVVNMKTAKALGVKIPNSILVRADKVIE